MSQPKHWSAPVGTSVSQPKHWSARRGTSKSKVKHWSARRGTSKSRVKHWNDRRGTSKSKVKHWSARRGTSKSLAKHSSAFERATASGRGRAVERLGSVAHIDGVGRVVGVGTRGRPRRASGAGGIGTSTAPPRTRDGDAAGTRGRPRRASGAGEIETRPVRGEDRDARAARARLARNLFRAPPDNAPMEHDASRLWPLGYHLTFHPYGTWLPGDDRGWHRHGDGPAHRPPSRALWGWCAERMRARALFFDPARASLVARSIRESCAHREWTIHALSVHADHVHVVVTAAAEAEAVGTYLKKWATRLLRTEGGVSHDQPVWARHGSTRTLVTSRRFRSAVRYVLEDRPR